MIQIKVYDIASQEQVQTMVVVNTEFYFGLLLGAITALTAWVAMRGVTE